jgi:hypothetical protein
MKNDAAIYLGKIFCAKTSEKILKLTLIKGRVDRVIQSEQHIRTRGSVCIKRSLSEEGFESYIESACNRCNYSIQGFSVLGKDDCSKYDEAVSQMPRQSLSPGDGRISLIPSIQSLFIVEL